MLSVDGRDTNILFILYPLQIEPYLCTTIYFLVEILHTPIDVIARFHITKGDYPCENLPNSNDLTKKEVTFLSIETR